MHTGVGHVCGNGGGKDDGITDLTALMFQLQATSHEVSTTGTQATRTHPGAGSGFAAVDCCSLKLSAGWCILAHKCACKYSSSVDNKLQHWYTDSHVHSQLCSFLI